MTPTLIPLEQRLARMHTDDLKKLEATLVTEWQGQKFDDLDWQQQGLMMRAYATIKTVRWELRQRGAP